MIKKIKVNDIASYRGGEQIIEAKHINFLFGLNGSGKTTISRYLRTPDDPRYANCSVEWTNTLIKTEVYNRDYVNDNFNESSIPGIFTLGKGNIETQKKIQECKEERRRLNDFLKEREEKLNGSDTSTGLRSQLSKLVSDYTNKFWKIKQKIDTENSSLRFALEGYRSSKTNFKDRLLREPVPPTKEIKERAELEELCAQLFAGNAEKSSILDIPSFDSLIALEKEEVLQKVVVGKEDVSISTLIKKLGNDSWFRQGQSYIANSEGLCPFCQRPLEQDFLEKIAEYFDESYATAVQEIDRITNTYRDVCENLSLKVKTIIDSAPRFIKTENLDAAHQKFSSIVTANIKKLSNKKSAPNTIVQLESSKDASSLIVQLLKEANLDIDKYNKRIEDITNERVALTAEVWKYIRNDSAPDIEMFSRQKSELEKEIKSKEDEIESIKQKIANNTQKMHLLEQQLTSVLPTANEINALLRNYGFTGFSLNVDEGNKTYIVVREDGVPAQDSLSEGERSFVTFLYFIHSLKGNAEENGHNEDKVVVIDDPVSSLDSDVLFVVSSLLRDLFQKIYAGEGTIKQLFILSHNSFFYKEASYKKGINKNKTGYWIIAKTNNVSKIKEYQNNPVSSTYEMLWKEVKKAESNQNPAESNTISLANTMRRIIEHYFNLLGRMDLKSFHSDFPDGERQVFKSLISWANSGSHSAFDDYSATPNLYNTEKYLKVFKDLFEKTGHKAHYNMMMETNQK